MDDERLDLLKWQHLKAELDNRKNLWPEGSEYEFDHEKRTVTWFLETHGEAPERLVWRLRREELWSPNPTEVADRIIKSANKVAKGEN